MRFVENVRRKMVSQERDSMIIEGAKPEARNETAEKALSILGTENIVMVVEQTRFSISIQTARLEKCSLMTTQPPI